jgi:GDP-6-deoxy-D-talose 4-dehydrogenase
MKILITGINGFVGKTLHKVLEKRGEEVYGLDIEGNETNIFQVDISDQDQVTECITNVSPDFIFHLAAVSRVDLNNPQEIFKINFNGTINLLFASIKLKKVPRFLFVSSSQVYGIVDKLKQPLSEDVPANPVNMYGASKAAGENAVVAFHHEYDLPVVIARPFNHTGRWQALNFIVPKLVYAFKEKKSEIKLGNIQVYRDFLDVRDVVNAYIKIMDNFYSNEVYNISSEKYILILEIISLLKEITGHDPEIITDDGFLRKNEIVYALGDSSKIKKQLNWVPKYSLTETLKWMLEDVD